MSLAIKSTNLTKTFGSFTAVDAISFEVEEGKIVGFIGANGAGKTTTIKMLCGLTKPTSGEAMVAGYDVAHHPEQVRQSIGYMSQRFSLYHDLTVRENIEFYGGVYGLRNNELKKRLDWVVEVADLKGREDILTKDLPLGWRQRLALGCAVLHEPKVVFLDEPTSGVDPVIRDKFWQLIGRLSQEGATIVVTTHHLEEAEFCESIIMMHLGKIVVQGSPETIRKQFSNLPLFEIETLQALRVFNLLEPEPWISEAAVFGGSVHVYAEGNDPIGAIERLLKKNQIEKYTIAKAAPTLEDIFINANKAGVK
ncbi:MAG TPA: ABC transporter ATP-binding protein [Candidatus Acidoferrales bacterium]|nr:ABC transporter ATP-binding protein [Candidatus Acidoferrales bacterium]